MGDNRPQPESVSIEKTDFKLSDNQSFYRGKVRDVYCVEDRIIMVASDRLSAFDHVLPRAIPYKGAVLNGIAAYFLNNVGDIVPHWLEATPDPNVSIGKYCEPIKVEMVIRGYLAGHAWRVYNSGARSLCGAELPDGLKESDKLPSPIITPSTKAENGHDEDISPLELIESNIVPEDIYTQLEKYTRALFHRGTEMAAERGLILVDTKYEFGLYKGQVMLMDEIHTPDSSRYYIADSYEENQEAGIAQEQLSKEFVREWLMDHDFRGRAGDIMPEMNDDFIWEISDRYRELYERLTGEKLHIPHSDVRPELRAYRNITEWLKKSNL